MCNRVLRESFTSVKPPNAFQDFQAGLLTFGIEVLKQERQTQAAKHSLFKFFRSRNPKLEKLDERGWVNTKRNFRF